MNDPLKHHSEFLGADPERVTALLRDWGGGNAQAHRELVELLYPRLRNLARQARRGEGAGRTLQTTALVHEAYIRLLDADVDWESARHFLRVAARAMRRVLVDHARARKRKKRGGAERVVALDAVIDGIPTPDRPDAFLQLDEAVERLLTLDERRGTAIELLYFGGLSYEEIAKVLDVSEATVHRELRAARAWLMMQLEAV